MGSRANAAFKAASEQRLHAEILAQISDAVIAVDTNLNVTYLNAAAEQRYEVTAETAVGRPLSELYTWLWLEPSDEALADAALEERGSWRGENVHVTRSGKRIPVESLVSVLRDSRGQRTGLLATVRDITDRKQAEAAARRAEGLARDRLAELEDLYRNAPVGLCVLDRNLRYLRVNERLAEINGIPASEHIGKSVRELMPALASTIEARLLQVIESGEPLLNVELLGETPAAPGIERSWLENWLPVIDADGQVTGVSIVVEETTSRKSTEDALRRSQQFLKAITSVAPVILYVYDVENSRNVWSNDGLTAVLGYTAEEVLGMGDKVLPELIHGDDLKRYPEHFERLKNLAPGETAQFEYRMRHKDGSWRWLVSHERVFQRNNAEEVVQIAGAAQDITERREIEGRLRQSEERYRQLFDNMSEGSAIHEPILNDRGEAVSYRHLEANAAWERLTGLKRAEVIGRDVRDFLPNIEPIWVNTFAKVASTGESAHVEHFARDLNNWYSVSVYCPRPGQAVSIFTNVTERRKVEDTLRRNAETFAALVEQAPLGIYTVDSQFRMRNVSVGAMSAFRNVHPLIGRDFGEVMRTIWPEPFASEAIERFRHTLETGEPYISPGLTEQRRDVGVRESYEWQINRVTLADGHYGVVCYFFDTTRIRQANEEVHAYAEHLKRANEDLLHFAYAVSHDLQTPIRTITTFGQLLALKAKEQLGADGEQYLRFMVEAGSRMSTMIQDLLHFAQVAGAAVECEPVSLKECLAAALQALSADIKDSAAAINQDPLPTVSAAAGPITSLFQNLVGNAIKYRKADTAPVIQISAERTGEQVVISVRDNGVGFEPKYAERIFGVFQRLDTTRAGTGIGLTISKRIVEKFGGRIWATSEPGQGSTFSFSLPLTAAPAPCPSIQSPVVASSPHTAQLPTRTAADTNERLEIAALDEVFEALKLSPVFICAMDGTIRVWTDGAERQYGWSRSDAIGRKSQELLETVLPAPLLDIQAELLRAGSWTGEVKQTKRDGTIGWFASYWTLHRDGSGRPQSIIKTAAEVTSLKEAERALRRSEERLRMATAAAQIGIHDYDPQSGIIVWDERIRALWGVGPDEPITFDVFLSGLHPDDRKGTQDAIERALDPAGSGHYFTRYRVINRNDHSEHWLEAEGRVFFEDGIATRLVGTVLEITERKEVEERLHRPNSHIQ